MTIKIKVLIYSDCIYFGGCENLLTNIMNSKQLDNEYKFTFAFARHKSYVFGNKIPDKIKLFPLCILSQDNILYDYGEKIPTIYFPLIKLVLQILQKILFGPYNFLRLLLFFLKQRPDIIHINNGGYPAAKSCRLAAVTARLVGNKKIIMNINNLALPVKSCIDRLYDKIVNNSVDYFITASRAACINLVDIRHFTSYKITNIPNTLLNDSASVSIIPLLRKEFNLTTNTIVIGSAGLLTQRKGFHVLIEAISRIKEIIEKNGVKIFVFGEGEQRKQLEEIIMNKEIAQFLFLPGQKVDILNYIADFDIFILPSIGFEDFPYVNLEAMFLGKPIISTNVAGIPEQVESNVNGYLISPNDVDALVGAITLLIENKELRQNMGLNSKKMYLEKFNYENIIKKYNNIYLDLLEKD